MKFFTMLLLCCLWMISLILLLLFSSVTTLTNAVVVVSAAPMNAPVGVQQQRRQQKQQQQQQQKGQSCDSTTCDIDGAKSSSSSPSTAESTTSGEDDGDTTSCRFYLSESQVYKGKLGLFTTTHFNTGDVVNGDFWIPIPNYPNPIEYSMWHDIALRRHDIHSKLYLEYGPDALHLMSFVAGIGSTSCCHDQLANIHPTTTTTTSFINNEKQQQQRDDHHQMDSYLSYVATSPIRPGQELFTTCNNNLKPEFGKLVHPIIKPIEALTQWSYGTCMDRLFVKYNNNSNNSSSSGGSSDNNNNIIEKPTAHSKRFVSKGQVVASSPIVLIDRSQMEIVKQYYDFDQKKVVYTSKVERYQELVNYCYGHVNSSVLLLPYGPNVYAITHSTTISDDEKQKQQQQVQPNVKLAWNNKDNSKVTLSFIDYLNMDPIDAMDQNDGHRLIIDYVATRDIYPGEQIILDGGQEYQKSWKQYHQNNTTTNNNNTSTGSSNNNNHHRHLRHYHHPKNEPIRTVLEQSTKPYPKWIQTACWYREIISNEGNENNPNKKKLIWNSDMNNDCLRPCHIVERHQQIVINQNNIQKNSKDDDDEYNNTYLYTVRITDIPNPLIPTKCKLSNITKGRFVHEVPSEAITFVNKPRSKVNEKNDNPTMIPRTSLFRHELAVPDHKFYPTSWYTINRSVAPKGDFLLPELQVGQIERIRWADTKEPVSSHAYVIGIPSSVREELMKFCNHMGITERFKELTFRGNAVQPGEEKEIILNGNSDWLIQRPMNWKSNLHWISPANKASHREYLQALSAGGYDQVLSRVGTYFGFDGLACYHIAFIAVSHSTGGLMHFDVDQTGGKAFAMIVPLILVPGTDPELALRAEENDDNDEDEGQVPPRTGGLKYRYEVAAMMGDKAHHSTSSVDYRVSKEMRMAATIYVADINKYNLEAILAETQNYPPRDRPDLLWSMAGRDWKRDDPSVKLPKPTSDIAAATAAEASTCEAV